AGRAHAAHGAATGPAAAHPRCSRAAGALPPAARRGAVAPADFTAGHAYHERPLRMTGEELCAIAHRGLALLPAPLLRYHPKGRHEVREGVALVTWGTPGPSFNKAAVLGPAPPLARVRELASAFFGCGPEGYGIMVQADAGHPVEAELRQQGWQVVEDEPAL